MRTDLACGTQLTCNTLARFYQVQSGHRTGYLYRRCECGADQKTGAAVQVNWLQRMARTPEPMIPHPLEAAREQQGEPATEPEPKPAQPPADGEGNPKTEQKHTGLIGLGILIAAGAVALLT